MHKVLIFFLSFSAAVFSQYNIDYFIKNALANSPQIKKFNNLFLINDLQNKIDIAENSALRVSLTADYLFAPYFNNDRLISVNPSPEAIGYDVGITNGGLYSALINVEKNIFNGAALDALIEQRSVQGKSYESQKLSEEHDLIKLITDEYINTFQFLELYNLSKEIVNTLQNQLKITGGLITKGISDVHTYLLLKVETRSQQINLDQTLQNYNNSLVRLCALSGISDTEIVLIDSVNLSLSPKVENSKFLTQYYLDSLNAAAQENIFRAGYFPQVKLFFNTGLNAVGLDNIERKFGISAGFNISMPIFDGGKKDFMRQETLISENSSSESKIFAARNIIIQRRGSENKIASLKKSLDDYKNQIEDYKKLLNLSLEKLEKGNLTMIEYLTEIRNYIEIQKEYITAGTNYQLEISNYNYWNW